jgi:hypothetical protein
LTWIKYFDGLLSRGIIKIRIIDIPKSGGEKAPENQLTQVTYENQITWMDCGGVCRNVPYCGLLQHQG